MVIFVILICLLAACTFPNRTSYPNKEIFNTLIEISDNYAVSRGVNLKEYNPPGIKFIPEMESYFIHYEGKPTVINSLEYIGFDDCFFIIIAKDNYEDIDIHFCP